MKRLWHEAGRRLKPHRRSAAVIGAALTVVSMLCLLAGSVTQHILPRALQSWHLAGALLTALLACAPLRMQCSWQIGRLTGTLDENDLGFLACSSSLWLWSRAALLRLAADLLLIVSALPAFLLYAAAKSIWIAAPANTESIRLILTVLHLGMLSAAAVCLPLRIYAAASALPYCCLKAPHTAVSSMLRGAFRLTRGQSIGILRMRLCAAPFLLCPFTAVYVLPTLLAAEQIRCERVFRHQQPRSSSAFSGLELHACDPA